MSIKESMKNLHLSICLLKTGFGKNIFGCFILKNTIKLLRVKKYFEGD